MGVHFSQQGPGDPPKAGFLGGLFSGVQQKWQDFKDNLFGSGIGQPSNTDIGDAITRTGEQAQTLLDIQTTFIPGGSLLNPGASTGEQIADVGLSLITGLGLVDDAGKFALKSIVKTDSKLLSLARSTFKGNDKLSKEANGLISQLAQGNLNPGIGSKSLKGLSGISEARSRGGARVYFRSTDNGVDVLGYSNKKNQQQVIDRLKEVYNK